VEAPPVGDASPRFQAGLAAWRAACISLHLPLWGGGGCRCGPGVRQGREAQAECPAGANYVAPQTMLGMGENLGSCLQEPSLWLQVQAGTMLFTKLGPLWNAMGQCAGPQRSPQDAEDLRLPFQRRVGSAIPSCSRRGRTGETLSVEDQVGHGGGDPLPAGRTTALIGPRARRLPLRGAVALWFCGAR